MRHSVLALVAILFGVQHLAAEEFALPDFDLEKAKATYVVSLPENYHADRKWPLILDFHGAISPSRKGANFTRSRVWSQFSKKAPYIVVGINGRTRAWNMTRGVKNDRAYALKVLEAIREQYSIDTDRIYLAGFSSGADFLCSGGLQLEGPFAGSLVVCPGPPNVVGLKNGSLLKVEQHPFYFATGEEDFIRKNGAWEAFLTLDEAGANTVYRETPGVGHAFLGLEEYIRLFEQLGDMVTHNPNLGDVDAAAAIQHGDFLLASTYLLRNKSAKDRDTLLDEIKRKGETLSQEAAKLDPQKEPGRAYEAWWRIRTQFHRFPPLATRAQKELTRIEELIPRRDLYRARGEWFRSRRSGASAEPKPAEQPKPSLTPSITQPPTGHPVAPEPRP